VTAAVALSAIAAVVAMAAIAIRAARAGADGRTAAADLRAELVLVRADAASADAARERAEARAAVLEEELAHADEDPPAAPDVRAARARTARLVRRWAEADALRAARPAPAAVPAPTAAGPADESQRS